MPLTPAVWQEPGLVVGSATTTPIDLTRSLAAGRPTRSILPRQTRRNWRRNRTQNPPYPSRHSVPENGTTSLTRSRAKQKKAGLNSVILDFDVEALGLPIHLHHESYENAAMARDKEP